MGNFGKGTIIQFFMTEKDEKEFFDEIKKDNLLFAYEEIDPSTKKTNIKTFDTPPHNWKFMIFNKDIDDSIEGIDFYRSVKKKKVLIEGSIGALLSEYKYNKTGSKIETVRSKEFIKWWGKMNNWIKKNYTKVYPIGALTKHNKNYPANYAGKDAIKLYNKGFILSQLDPSTVYNTATFHPLSASQKKAERHDREFLREMKENSFKLKQQSRKKFNFVTSEWEAIK